MGDFPECTMYSFVQYVLFFGGFCSKMPVISAVFPLHCINRFWLIQLIFISQFEKKDVVENILLIPEALQFC